MLRVIKSSEIFEFEAEPVRIENAIITEKPEPEPEPELPPEEELTETDGEFIEISRALKMQEEEEKARLEEEQRKREEEIEAEIERRLAPLRAELEKGLDRLNEKAERVITDAVERARKEEEQIRIEALNEARETKIAAYNEGFEEGKKAGIEQAQKYISAAAEFLNQINANKEAYFLSHKDEFLDTGYYIIEKIIGCQLSVDKKTIASIVKEAAKNFRNSKSIRISVSETDIGETATADVDFIKKAAGNIPDIEIEILPDADPGTVVIDNGSEIIDASVPTQLDLLKEIMENSRIKRTDTE